MSYTNYNETDRKHISGPTGMPRDEAIQAIRDEAIRLGYDPDNCTGSVEVDGENFTRWYRMPSGRFTAITIHCNR